MVSIGNGSVYGCSPERQQSAVATPRYLVAFRRCASSSTAAAVQAADVCVWKLPAAFGRACVVRHFCEAGWRGGARSIHSLANRPLLTRLHCYTPDRPALSCHLPKTAQSGGSGAQVRWPRLMSDSNPVLTSPVQSGTFRQEGGHHVGTKQLCDLLL